MFKRGFITPFLVFICMEKFYRTYDDRVFFGICSGLGVRTNIDPLVWRLLFFFLIFSPVPIITGYLLTTILTKSV
jgi:phage shock protein PspC (stress-responsive transcriptional regulator)